MNRFKKGKIPKESHLEDTKMAEKTFRGKSMKPGGGGRFAKMVGGLEKSGKSEESAKAIAASAGRAKYGASKMASFSKEGLHRKMAESLGAQRGQA